MILLRRGGCHIPSNFWYIHCFVFPQGMKATASGNVEEVKSQPTGVRENSELP